MAKSGAFRWQSWPSNTSRTNPDGLQRECASCQKPFVTRGTWDTRCPRCTSASPASAARAHKSTKKPKHRGSRVTFVSNSKRLASAAWPPPNSRALRATADAREGALHLRWPKTPGEATVQVFDASGVRVAHNRTQAASGKQRFRAVAHAAQPLTVLIEIVGQRGGGRAHAKAHVHVAP